MRDMSVSPHLRLFPEGSLMLPDSRENSSQTLQHLRRAGWIAAAVVAVIAANGIASRVNDARTLKSWTDAQSVPIVTVTTAQADATNAALELPGRLEAYARAPIYARVSGYLKSWQVDIGAHVKAGQLLADIETPDLDQQLLQAKADLVSAQANASLAETTAKRWQSMLGSESVSQQEVDEKTGDYAAKQAIVNAARANMERIQAMKDFAHITAPFDGVVTARETDIGALINAGSGTGPELFVVSDVRKLRVYVRVPQNYVPSIKPGSIATISVPEYPGKSFQATVEASANAVDAQSGTTLVQLAVDNSDGSLMPGDYASVHLPRPVDDGSLRIPASALIYNGKGLHVAMLGTDDTVTFKQVSILRDDGKSVVIGTGLAAGDRVIESPPDGLADGDRVKVAVKAELAAAQGQDHEKKA
jgi:RND family efflux transporter MFP subunit